MVYRCSPDHKGETVSFIKKFKVFGYPITMSVGDGANDVVMIHKADVGVGIKGKEGNSACTAADYALLEFK